MAKQRPVEADQCSRNPVWPDLTRVLLQFSTDYEMQGEPTQHLVQNMTIPFL